MKIGANKIYLIVAVFVFALLSSGCDNGNAFTEETDNRTPILDSVEESQHEYYPTHTSGRIVDFQGKYNLTGKNVRVAVLDTGIDKTNTDFDDAIVAERNFISRDSEDVTDKNSHGTKMASIIGAREDGKNLLGVAPKSDLLIGKVANDDGYVKAKWLADGINWAVEKKADIINISLQLYRSSEELKNAIDFAMENNVIILASAGNPKYEGDTRQVFPAKYSGVISVAPATSDEMLRTPKPLSAEFKEKNPTVYAPGEHILADYFNNKLTDDYGASYATAVASGVAALSVQYYKEHEEKFNSEKIAKEIKRLLNQPGIPIWAYAIIGFLALIIISVLCLVFIKKNGEKQVSPKKGIDLS